MQRNIRGLATSMEYIVITIISQRKNDLLHLFPISSSICMKLKISISVISGYLCKMKLGFVFVRLVHLKSDICLKLNEWQDKFIKGSN